MSYVKYILEKILSIFFNIFFLLFPLRNINKKLSESIKLYKGEGFGEIFAKIRAWDAPYEIIDKLTPKNAKVVDLGCGDGLLANYLALSSTKRKIYGIDINKDRISRAQKGIKNTKFETGDILKIKKIKPDVLVMAHVLHHLPTKNKQLALLKNISNQLKKNKQLIILEIDKKPALKYLFTYITDAIIVPVLFEKKLFDLNFHYRSSSEWKKILTSLGFDIKTKSIHKGMPFSHVLIYGKKVA